RLRDKAYTDGRHARLIFSAKAVRGQNDLAALAISLSHVVAQTQPFNILCELIHGRIAGLGLCRTNFDQFGLSFA
ncbi:hypothetical protein, partial [Pseudomonas aeruginosa]|uniref:hypothetical protein n=1 Tax=Pseudomonas aeruginosa TaxID=287 RepID=UPI001C8B68D3